MKQKLAVRGAEMIKFDRGSSVLVIVAHPDDEVIWAGGLIRSNPMARFSVLSLCRRSDADRAPKFARVAEELGFAGTIEDLDDNGMLTDEDWTEAAKQVIKRYLAGREFDYLFTHGANGEYGHRLHKLAHQAVAELAASREIGAGKILFFAYEKIDRKILPMVPAKDADYLLAIPPAVYEEKRRVVAEMYGYPYEGIDVNLCTNIEAFKQYK